MKKLNIPLIVGLMVGSVGLAIGVHFLHGYQVNRSVDGLLQRAERAGGEGNVEEQLKLLRRYVQHRPKDLEQRQKLFKLSREYAISSDSKNRREWWELLQAIERAIRENPEDVGLRREGFELNATLGQFAAAIEHATQLKAVNAIKPEDEVRWAQCHFHNSEVDAATDMLAAMIGFNTTSEEFEEGKATAPNEIEAYAMLAGIYMQEKSDDDQAVPRKILDTMVERNPKSADAYLRRVAFLQSSDEDNLEQMSKDIAEAEKNAPDDPSVMIAVARLAMQQKDLDKAETVLKRGVEKVPNDPRFYRALADLYLQREKPDEAMKTVEAGLAKMRSQPDLLYLRAVLELDKNDLVKAQETIDRLSGKGNNVGLPQVQYLKSRMMMAKGDYPAAVTSFERLLPLLDSNPSLRNMVVRHLMDGYRRLNRPDKVAALLGATGDGEKFQAEQVWARAELLGSQGDLEGALKLFKELMDHKEELTPQGRELVFQRVYRLLIAQQAALPAAQRNWSQVDRMTAELLKRDDMPPDAKELLKIELLIQKEQLSEARRLTERAIAQYPRQASFLMLMNRLTNDPEQGLKLLTQYEQLAGDSAELRAARAERLVQAGGDGMAAGLQKLEENTDKLTLDEQLKLWQALAAYNDRIGESGRAIELWKRTLTATGNEKNIMPRQIIFELATRTGDEAVMDEMIKSVGEIVGAGSSEVLMMEATKRVWKIQQGKADIATLDEVTQMVDKVKAERQDYAPVYALQADVYILRNQWDLAAESLETALTKRQGDARYLRKIIDVLTKSGKLQEAAKYVAQLPEGQRGQADVLSELRLLVNQDPEKAYERVQELVPDDSQDPAQLNLRAEVEHLTGHHAEAVTTLDRLLKIDAKPSRPWLLYVRSLVALNRKADAEAAIARISTSVDEADLPLLLGQCHTTVGNLAAAAEAYDQGLKKNPDDMVLVRNRILVDVGLKQDDAAKAALDKLIQGESTPERLDTIVWARRLKAQMLNSTGRFKDFSEAVKLLAENKDPATGEMYAEDLLLWLSYSARRDEPASRQAALTRLANLEKERELTPNEKEVLAYLHKVEGRWDEAKDLMVGLVASNPNNTDYLARLIEWLLERDDLADAGVWIQKLNPELPAVIRYRALLLAKQNKAKEAARLVLTAVPSKLDLASAAQLLEEMGAESPAYFKVADAQWKKLVAQKPEVLPKYIEFLTRCPKGEKLGDALSAAETELKKEIGEKDSAAIQFYLSLALEGLRSHRKYLAKDSPHFEQVAKWFDMLRSVDIDPLTLAWSEIDYYDIRRDYKKLESLYLELLKNPSLSSFQKAVIRNNLAYGYAITNQGEKALKTIGDAIDEIGPSSDFLDTRGLAYLSTNKIDLAVKDLRDAVSGGEGTASTYFHLALAEWKAKRLEQAKDAMTRATELGLTEADLSPAEVQLYRQLQAALKRT